LNYVDANGILHTLQGLPEHAFGHNLGKFGAFVREEGLSTGEDNKDSPFGRLRTLEGRSDLVEINGPYTPIAEGDDLSSEWNKMREFGGHVDSTGYEYRPYSQNSNSFAAGALRRAGLLGPGTAVPETFDYQIAIDPTSGQPASFSVPGFDRRLLNPIDEPPSGGFDARFGNWPSQANAGSGNAPHGRVVGVPGASVFEAGAAPVRFVPSNDVGPLDPRASFDDRFGDWSAASPEKQPPQTDPSKVRVLSSRVFVPDGSLLRPDILGQARQQSARPPGIATSRPMPDYPVPPSIFGLPDRSAATGDDMDDWLSRWIKLSGHQ
jgi:hypothetical protein